MPKDIPAIIRFLGKDFLPEGKTIAEKIRLERWRRGWSQEKLAKHLGVDESSITKWENGRVILLSPHRLAIAEFIGMPFEEVDMAMRALWKSVH